MSEVTLHDTPRFRDVLPEQIRVGLSLRREALIGMLVLAIVTLPVVSEIVRGGPGFDSNETFPTALFSIVFPFLVWRGERPFGPAFLWTLPVDRRRIALARVFAGLVWLTIALAVFVSWLIALALFAHVPLGGVIARVPFVATIAAYLFGSALVLGLRHPLRWVFGSAAVFLLVGGVSEVFGSGPSGFDRFLSSIGFVSTVNSGANAWLALPDPVRCAIATFLALGGGLAALWLALSRHKENRAC